MIKNFRTYDLAVLFFKNCKELKIKGVAQNQFDRALLSIPLNLVEGSAKPSRKDRRKFYYIAFGSLREVQVLLNLYGSSNLIEQADRLAAHLYQLCKNA